jgi:hypothetical protein
MPKNRRTATTILAALTAFCVMLFALTPGPSGANDASVAKKAKCKKGKKARTAKKKCKKHSSSAVPAALSISPATHDFGDLVGKAPTFVFTLSNRGGSPSGVPVITTADNGVSLGAPRKAGSVVANSCTAPIPAAGSCTFTVEFDGTAFYDNNPNGTITAVAAPGGTAVAYYLGKLV